MSLPFHIIDFEGSKGSGVVEYGIVRVEGRMIRETKTRLCGAEGEITWRERDTHGLSQGELAGVAPFREEWTLFSKLREHGPFGAHNAMVEAQLLSAIWPYPRLVADFSEEPPVARASWGPWLDTLHLYRRLYPNLPEYGLSSLIDQFGLQATLDQTAEKHCPEGRGHYHCALYDALASAILFIDLQSQDALAKCTPAWWLRQSAASTGQRQAMDQGELGL